MKVQADTEVTVLSEQTDLDLAISTWLPGYVAQRTDDLDIVMDITRRGGVVLIDLGSPRHEEWVAGLRERGFDGPTVFLDPRGDMTIDLRDRVVVTSPPSLAGLLTSFEVARSDGRGPRRRSDRDAEPLAPRARRRRTRSLSGRDANAVPLGDVEQGAAVAGRGAAVAGRARRVDRGQPRAAVTSAGRGRRMDRRQHQQPAASVSRERRVDRWGATRPGSVRGWLRRRFGVAGSSLVDEAGPLAAPTSPRIDAEAEREFQKVFRAAEEQPAVRRRVATPDGRIRVQTDEELFEAHPAAPVVADAGAVLTALPPPRRRTRAGT